MMDDPSHLGLNYNRVDMGGTGKTFFKQADCEGDDSLDLEDSAEYELLCRLIYAVCTCTLQVHTIISDVRSIRV